MSHVSQIVETAFFGGQFVSLDIGYMCDNINLYHKYQVRDILDNIQIMN